MITKLEVLNTIAGRYGYKDWIHIGFFKEPAELTTMIIEAMDLYTEQSNSHKHSIMQTLPFSFVEWYSGMQKEKIESAYKRWMKEGNVAVGQRSVGTNAEAVAFNCFSSDSLVYNKPCKEWCGNPYCKREAPSGGHL